MKRVLYLAQIFSMIFFSQAEKAYAADVDWAKIGESRIVLFYPGVASWEFLTGDDHRLGGREIKNGKKNCKHCHLSRDGELDLKADEIAAGAVKMKRSHNPFEPEPMPGRKGTVTAKIKAAYDREYLYIRLEWESKGTGWQKKGEIPDRVSIQLNRDEGAFKRYGCFITCHNDLNTMPGSPSKKEVLGNPYYKALDRDDVRLYAAYAKTSWSERKSDKELKKLKEDGNIDLWSLEYAGGAVKSMDGWVFDDRNWEEKSDLEGAGAYENGKYTAVFKRKLKSDENSDISLSEGDVLSAGVAIHEDKAEKRRHYVTFPFTIGIGANAEVRASNLE